MKILFIAPFNGISGGILRWAENIYRYYESLNQDKVVLTKFSTGRSRFININQPFFYRLFYGIKDYVGIIQQLQKQLKTDKYDIIHLASSASISLLKDLLIVQLAHRHKAKIIVHFHFGRIPELKQQNNWEWKFLKRIIIKSDQVIVIDRTSYKTLIDQGFKNISIVPNPVAPELIKSINNIQPRKIKLRTILFVGHVVKTKGVFELVMSCKSISNIKLMLIGSVERQIKEELETIGGIDCKSWLNITGDMPYDDVIKEMMQCDIFVLPTYTEGFPNVILESMACGCAIVSTTVGAIPEMVDDENGHKCGILVKPRNRQELRDAICNLLTDESRKEQMRLCAYNLVRKKYSMKLVWQQLENIWNNLETVSRK